WKLAAISEQTKRLNHDPVILYAEYTIPELQIKVQSDETIMEAILVQNALSDATHPINKIKKLIDTVKRRHLTLTNKSIHLAENPAAVSFQKYLRAWDEQLLSLKARIEIRLATEIQRCLTNHTEQPDAITNLALLIKNANLFNKQFFNEDYFSTADVVLAIANHLHGLIQKSWPLNQEQANHFRKIITTVYPLSGVQLDNMINLFKELPETLKKIQSIDSKSLLAFITHHIEAPLLSLSDIRTPLARHKHIAKRQRRPWIDMSENNIYDEKKDEFATLISYIKNVSQELISLDNTIDLTNFDVVFCPETSFVISPGYTQQLEQMKNAKEIIETAISDKLDKALDIRYFLTDGLRIDLIKLPELLYKINAFFTVKDNKNRLLAAIYQACVQLLKNQIIDAVQNTKIIDLNYILNLNMALGHNTLKSACQDTAIKDILTKYIKTCDGSQSNLSIFFVEINDEENNQEQESLILSYAQKRLSFITNSYMVLPEDYHFFNHYSGKPFFKPLFEKFRQTTAPKIQKALSELGVWDKGYAGLIELFGTTIEAQAYRAKHLLELAESHDEVEDVEALSHFLFQLNPMHHVQRKIFDLKLTIKNALAVEKIIENIIMNTSWSISLEDIIQSLDTPSLTQLLHAQLLKTMLRTATDTSKNWLAITIARETKYFSEANKISKNIWNQLNKDFYAQFFGEKNMHELCTILEDIYNLLQTEERNLEGNAKISSLHFESICNKIKYAKLFSMLYMVFGDNDAIKLFINRLNEFEKKFKLQYELNLIFAENHPALSTTSSDIELKNLIVSIVKAEKQLETNGADAESVHHYLKFCSKEILEKIHALLENSTKKLKFAALSDLSNLLFHLSCDEIKLLLINAHKSEIADNPFWLSIINHYDKAKDLDDIIKSMPNQPTAQMRRLFLFANDLSYLKKRMQALLKKSLLEETGITINTINEGIKMRALLTEENINDKTLIKLWKNYRDKIETLQATPSTQKNYLTYGIKLLSRISDELLIRAQKRPEINELVMKMTKPMKEEAARKPTMVKDRSSFWARPAEQLELSAHVKSVHDKCIIISLMHIVAKYINHKMQKDNKSFFEDACQKMDYTDSTPSKEGSISDIIKRTKCIRPTAIKTLNCLHLYQKLSAILSGKERFQTIKEFINQLISELANDQINTPKYMKLLNGIHEAIENLMVVVKPAKNDKTFGQGRTVLIR
ncbi:MAG: hypothetical protein ACYC0J_07585, partial [Gammaproteobacteria bacterium]